jgi:hypothetical protein
MRMKKIFWFDDLSDASMEEAVTAETQDETFIEDVRKTMEEKKGSQGDTGNSVKDTGREIQGKSRKIQRSFVRMVDNLKTKIKNKQTFDAS